MHVSSKAKDWNPETMSLGHPSCLKLFLCVLVAITIKSKNMGDTRVSKSICAEFQRVLLCF